MRNPLPVLALAGVLMSGAAPAFADGDYLIGGATLSEAWRQPSGPAPRAEAARHPFSGGDDQYRPGPTRSLAWADRANGALLADTARRGPAGNFLLASQGG